jgi:hypothetical protein
MQRFYGKPVVVFSTITAYRGDLIFRRKTTKAFPDFLRKKFTKT